MSRLLGLLCITLALASGCYRQARLDIVQQSPAGLLTGYQKVFLAPLRMDGMLVEGVPEPQWFAAQGPRQQRIYAQDRALLAVEYQSRLRDALERAGIVVVAQPASDVLTVRGAVCDYWPGFWAFVGSDAKLRMVLEIADDPAGAPLDRVELSDRVKAEMWSASTTNRVRRLADALASLTARYVNQRTRTHM
jgi:hypothetical protein